MGVNRNLTQEELKRCLHYNPNTGIFRRKLSYNPKIRVGEIAGGESEGYIRIRVRGKKFMAHRLAWLYVYGYFPENQIDHIDRNRSNNKIDNLRHVSQSCNLKNISLKSNNTSGVTGVYWSSLEKRYKAGVKFNQKYIHLGTFENFNDAVKARWDGEIKYNYQTCNSTSVAYEYLKENNLI